MKKGLVKTGALILSCGVALGSIGILSACEQDEPVMDTEIEDIESTELTEAEIDVLQEKKQTIADIVDQHMETERFYKNKAVSAAILHVSKKQGVEKVWSIDLKVLDEDPAHAFEAIILYFDGSTESLYYQVDNDQFVTLSGLLKNRDAYVEEVLKEERGLSINSVVEEGSELEAEVIEILGEIHQQYNSELQTFKSISPDELVSEGEFAQEFENTQTEESVKE